MPIFSDPGKQFLPRAVAAPDESANSAQAVAIRVEELLREQLEEMGENPDEITPEGIAAYMRCEVFDDRSMVYAWKDLPILRVAPEQTPDGLVWRMFTRDEYEA